MDHFVESGGFKRVQAPDIYAVAIGNGRRTQRHEFESLSRMLDLPLEKVVEYHKNNGLWSNKRQVGFYVPGPSLEQFRVVITEYVGLEVGELTC